MAPYNPWYSYTYEDILAAADWSVSTSDISIKIVLIYSWMPTVIMNPRRERTLQEALETLEEIEDGFVQLPETPLWETEDLEPFRTIVCQIFDTLQYLLGGVAASKFLHFSRDRFFPMYDTAIATVHNGNDYFEFMVETAENLADPENFAIACEKYWENPLRGWDIHLMEDP